MRFFRSVFFMVAFRMAASFFCEPYQTSVNASRFTTWLTKRERTLFCTLPPHLLNRFFRRTCSNFLLNRFDSGKNLLRKFFYFIEQKEFTVNPFCFIDSKILNHHCVIQSVNLKTKQTRVTLEKNFHRNV